MQAPVPPHEVATSPVNDGVRDFCHLAAHDLQAPIRQARHLSDCIHTFLDDADIDRAHACATDLSRVLSKMKQLVAALLDLSTTANLVTEFVSVDMDKVVEAAIARNRLGLKRSDAKVSTQPLPNVIGDADLLTRALSILIGNAVLYVDNSVIPDVRIEGLVRQGSTFIYLHDNGIGIPDGYHRRVFEPLIRVHTNPAHYGGVGIGLSLVQKILRSHGGDISALPRDGGGTTFVLRFPSHQKQDHPT